MTANAERGEAELVVVGERYVIRPSFSALVAAEADLGSLFALVERAAAGQMALEDMAGLFWHCIADRPETLSREDVGQAVLTMGLANATPILRTILHQVLQGR
ncbi:gene transfer agent family protein [Parasphingorhabdus sp. SCSIO 66989]|uniref:Gene transfer agent family protein n=1 Tax=Alterisphingorhabdus coralli TaxID=3071408 RepID=A0AA97F8Y7_9SPHN|nr:gene transfer agent family protein [Parasphingorhabdus sp. SCSIO 66989]WOE76584.1 gene transfer agent family protein [Parasphingorhabdus sp. SCSIO 66989]